MASKTLSKDEQNFIWISIVCVDFIKLPLKDILANQITPTDLYQRINSSPMKGKDYLRREQLNICFIPPPDKPDYNNFDVTLLYTLIRNLCSTSLNPTQGWGKVPDSSDTQIGDDIERLRLMRNKFAHANSTGIPDAEFQALWNDLKSVIQRIQSLMKFDYEQKLADIKKIDFRFEDLLKYKGFLEATLNLLKDEPEISIKGTDRVVCGEKTCFEADLKQEEISHWSISWQIVRETVTNQIDTSKEKYSGSTRTQLVIHSVSKDDEGEYQAVLARESNGNKRKIESNAVHLRVVGGLPKLEDLNVRTDDGDIIIQYNFQTSLPNVTTIEWTKNGDVMDFKNPRYVGGGLLNICLTITSPTKDDKGTYSCTVKNIVGSTSKDVILDIPSAKISNQKSKVYFGSKSNIRSTILSTPQPNKVEWQKSVDGDEFHCIDINTPEYDGSYIDLTYPSLVIPNTTFENMLYYRLRVWNAIGECVSNTVFLDVTGNPPNITISHETCFQTRSLKLIAKVFPYDECHATRDVFWTVNGEKIDKRLLGGKYSTVSVNDPSLTIHNLNKCDKGSYKLTATNAVGSTTSDAFDIGIPDVSLVKFDKKEGGNQWCTVSIKSIPEPFLVQWSKKEKNGDTVQLINVNAEEYKGSSCSLTHPVLVVKQREHLEHYNFQIEVRSFIGTCTKTIQNLLDDTDLSNLVPGTIESENVSSDETSDGSLNELYDDDGAGIRFATLFDDLADGFPEEKFQKLKDLIQSSKKVKTNVKSLNEAKSARDCFRILDSENLFSHLDVTFMQFLLRKTECKELETKCVEYAKRQQALGFYEKQTEDGFKHVYFHVLGDLSTFNQEKRRKIQETISAIVGCQTDRIFFNGYRHSESFIAIVSVEVIYVKKLLAINDQDKHKFVGLDIDYFTVDFVKIFLGLSKESKQPTGRFLLEKEQVSKKYVSTGIVETLNKSKMEFSSSKHFKFKETLMASIGVSLHKIQHISCLKPGRLWYSFHRNIVEIDENGLILRELDVDRTHVGYHTMTKDGDLLFKKDDTIYMLTRNGEVRNLHIPVSSQDCIHSSRINCDIFVCSRNRLVKRYDMGGCRLKDIDIIYIRSYHDEIKEMFDWLKWKLRRKYDYGWKGINELEREFRHTLEKQMRKSACPITENINGDIITTNGVLRNVVAVDSDGRYRFTYQCCSDPHYFEKLLKGLNFDRIVWFGGRRNRLNTIGICNDLSGHILVGDNYYEDQGVHLLDKDGKFLAKLLTHQSLNLSALCVDDRNNLYVEDYDRICIFTYLSDTTTKEHDSPLIESELKPKAIQI